MSDATALSVPPAGWYPDRNEANVVRWWDGQQWTDQTQSTAPAAAAFEQPVSASAFGFVPPEQNPVAQIVVQSQVAQVAQAGGIPPGWYPDNADPSLQRWWDGVQWTTHTATAASPVQQWDGTGRSTSGAGPVSSANNTMSTLSLIFSVLSFGGLFLVWLLPLSLAGIIVGIVALRRAPRFEPSGRRRGQATAGIITGGISLVLTILLTVAALVVYQQVHQVSHTGTQQSGQQTGNGTAPDPGGVSFPSTLAELKQAIAKSVARQNSEDVTTVTCDGAASMVSGSIFDCGAQVVDGRWTTIRVNITYPTGSGMALGLGFGPLLDADADATTTPRHYTVDQIEQELTRSLAAPWRSDVSDLSCDPNAPMTQGSTFRCGLTLADGRTGEILITMTPPDGYDVTVTRPPADSSGSDGSTDTDPGVSQS